MDVINLWEFVSKDFAFTMPEQMQKQKVFYKRIVSILSEFSIKIHTSPIKLHKAIKKFKRFPSIVIHATDSARNN